MLKQNKSHVVEAGLIQEPCSHLFSSDKSVNNALLCPSVRQSVLLLNFVQSCYMDFSKLLDEFFKIDNGFL